MSISTTIPSVHVSRDGKLVATIGYAQRSTFYDTTEAKKIKLLLRQERFVYNPETRQLRVVGAGQQANRPDWWLAHVQEALWRDYDISVGQ